MLIKKQEYCGLCCAFTCHVIENIYRPTEVNPCYDLKSTSGQRTGQYNGLTISSRCYPVVQSEARTQSKLYRFLRPYVLPRARLCHDHQHQQHNLPDEIFTVTAESRLFEEPWNEFVVFDDLDVLLPQSSTSLNEPPRSGRE